MTLPYVFVEGDTEENIVIYLLERILGLAPGRVWKQALREQQSGKQQIARHIRGLGSRIGVEKVRLLVMRDLDEHEGETLARIRQSVEGAVARLLEARGYGQRNAALEAHSDFPNVFTYHVQDPDVRLALHVAHYPTIPGLSGRFTKSTTDDYLLALAFRPQTVSGLLHEIGLGNVAGDQIVRKVREEVPDLLQQNGIPVREAKDYVRIYLATVQLGMSPAVFAGKLLAHADEGEIEQVFASLIAALRFVTGKEAEK